VSEPLIHLTATAVKAIHAEVLAAHGGSPGIRDEALLESAVAAPQATMQGKPLLSDPLEIAAASLFYLCRNHPFMDGNKRTALAASLVFLEANDLPPSNRLPARDWETFVFDVAASRIDRDETTKRFKHLLKQLARKKT
jgi:death-on-curing protein